MDYLKIGNSFHLINAIVQKQLSSVKTCLQNGADVNFVNIMENNNTPLHYAYRAKVKDIVQVLKEAGANENAKNTDGKLPSELGLAASSVKLNKADSKKQGLLESNSDVLSEKFPFLFESFSARKKSSDLGPKSTYIKRSGTSAIGGQLYETKLLALALLRAIKWDHITSFFLGTNLDEAGAFDDIVLRYSVSGEKDKIILLQAKHKEETKKEIILKDLLDPNNVKGNFNLAKYFLSYLQIRSIFDEDNDIPVFNGVFEDTDIELIIYTPASVNSKLDDEDFKAIVNDTEETNMFYSFAGGKTISFDKFPQSFKSVAIQWQHAELADVIAKLSLAQNIDVKLVSDLLDARLTENITLRDIKTLKINTKLNIQLASDGKVRKAREKSLELLKAIKYSKLTLTDETCGKLAKDFYSKLKILCKQPTEANVEYIVKKEISEFYRKYDDYNMIFMKYHDLIQNWWKETGQEVDFLTKKCNFLDTTLMEIDKCNAMMNLHSVCMSKIKMYGVQFSKEVIYAVNFNALNHFMEIKNTMNRYLTILTETNELSCIKFVQYFDTNSWDFKYVSIPYIEIKHLKKALETNTKCLILSCNHLIDALLIRELTQQVQKVVIITDNKIDGGFESIHDIVNGLVDLTEESQQKVLEIRVGFQGTPVLLGSLIHGEKSLVNAAILTTLIEGQQFNLAPVKLLEKDDEVIKYYVERTLLLCTVSAEILNDRDVMFTLDAENIDESKIERNIVFVYGFAKFKSEKDFDHVIENYFAKLLCGSASYKYKDLMNRSYHDEIEQYHSICEKYSKTNIHMIEVTRRETRNDCYELGFLWQKSQGSLSKIREYMDDSKVEFIPSYIHDMSNNVVILAAEPGMGKTTIMAAITVKNIERLPSDWIVRINLLDHSNQLSQWQERKTPLSQTDALHFLTDVVSMNIDTSSNSGKFERALFQELCRKKRVTVLVDGFDEVSPDYDDEVRELLLLLRDNFAQILWVATRPGHVQHNLEDCLSVMACTLKPFTEDDSKLFLKKYWSVQLKLQHVDEERFNIFALELLKQFSHSIDQRGIEFMSVPLQIKMIAMVFQEAFHTFYLSGNDQLLGRSLDIFHENMDLLALYEKFIEIKYDILEEEKNKTDSTKIGNKQIRKRQFQFFIEKHELIAIHTLLTKSSVDKLLTVKERQNISEYLAEIQKSEEKTGIIYHVIGEKPLFVHQTYAEYLASLFVYQKYDSFNNDVFNTFLEEILLEDLVKNNRTQICKFLQLKVKKDIENLSNASIKADTLLNYLLNLIESFQNSAFEHVLKIVEHSIETAANISNVEQSIRKLTKEKRKLLLELTCELGCAQLTSLLVQIDKDSESSSVHNALHNAAKRGYVGIVAMLLENGADVNIPSKDSGITPLHLAAANGNLETVKLLLQHGADIDTTSTEDGLRSALHMASENGHLKVVKALVENGANIHSYNDLASIKNNFFTALHWAAKGGHVQEVRFLIEIGSNVNALAKDKQTPLYLATMEGKVAVVEHLLKYGANVEFETSSKNYTALHIASEQGHSNVIELLVKHGADLSATTKEGGFTPLYLASSFGKTNVVEILLKNGANVDACSNTGYTALHVAAQNGYDNIVTLLLKFGANKNAININNQTPMYWASYYGKTKVVEILLKSGADVAACSSSGYTALHVAAQNGYENVVTLLLINDADKNSTDKDHNTPLYWASFYGKEKVVEILLKSGADVDACSKTGYTALHIAAQNGYDNIAVLLLKFGANKNSTNKDNLTPMYLASFNGKTKVVEILIKSGSAMDACSNTGYTALHVAAQNGYDNIVSLLLTNGADKNSTNKDNTTPLYWASFYGKINVVQILLESGADVDACSKTGYTALHVAAQNGYDNIVALLLKFGANKNCFSKENMTPMYLASFYGKTKVIDLLLKSGADVDACSSTGYTALHVAAQEGHESVVVLLLNEGANINAITTDKGVTPLYLASRDERIKVVEILLARDADVHICETSTGYTALHVTLQKCNDSIAALLLQNGAHMPTVTKDEDLTEHDVDSSSDKIKMIETQLQKEADEHSDSNIDYTELHHAAEEGNEDLVELLLRRGSNINAKTKDIGRTPLYLASRNGMAKVVELLLKKGADLHIHSDNGYTALHAAAKFGSDTVVALLLKNGASIEATSKDDGLTSLHIASTYGNLAVVELLLKNGVDLHACSNSGLTALHIAAQKGYDDVVVLLLKYGANKNVTTKNDGLTPLYLASLYGMIRVVEILLENEVDVQVCSSSGNTALHVAAENGFDMIVLLLVKYYDNLDFNNKINVLTPLYLASKNGKTNVVEILLNRGAEVNICMTSNGFTALHASAELGFCEVVDLLLKHGANINIASTVKSVTPLFLASFNGKTNVVELLLKRGANLHTHCGNGFTALHVAAQEGKESVVSLLLEYGAIIDVASETKGLTPLILASAKGMTKVVEMLLKRRADASLFSRHGYTALHVAAQEGYDAIVTLLLNYGSNINGISKNTNDRTPLYMASFSGKTKVVEILLERGADVHVYSSFGYTALHIAARNGYYSIVSLLVKYGANINSPTKDKGWTALFLAIFYGKINVVEMLLEMKANVHIYAHIDYAALHWAAEVGDVKAVALLLKHGANINVPTKDKGWTPLFVATIYSKIKVVELLLEMGADVHSCLSSLGYTALHGAAQKGNDDIVVLLLKYGAKINVTTTNEGLTPLYLASFHGKTKIVEMLLEKGADIHMCLTTTGYTSLHGAAKIGYDDVIAVLLNHGANINAISVDDGLTPLYLASFYGKIKVVEMLLQRGANLHIHSSSGYTPLHGAAQKGYKNIVTMLLENGANINVTSKDSGLTPLYVASFNGKTKVVEMLLERGADLHALSSTGFKAFHIAAQKGYKDLVTLLLKNDENVNVTVTKDGRTALHLASENGHRDVVELLLERGANVGLGSKDDCLTPLHLAAQKGHTKIVETLIKYGANVKVTTTNNAQTPLYMASVNSHYDTSDLLKKYGATN